ncbi:purine nucleoside phosphorylase [Escherichia coli]|uniref:purine-nucleoside phosphorylase n=1 Tax=Escherichia coli TaxID=562 RepID=A0A376RGR5_ECOLX|nr:purine nucleoside phosphorylase [Escherichia coli]
MSQVQFSHNPLFCIDIIKTYKPDFTPRVAFILGSGLGALADQIENAVAISYEKLPGFPVSTVHGHAGELVLGHLQGVPVVCMKGRGHFYEGRGMTIMTDAIRTFKLLGCELLFCTNAAGSLRPEVGAGSLVALKDHINTMQVRRWWDLTMIVLESVSSHWQMPTMRNTRTVTKSGERRGFPSDGGRVRLVSGAEFRGLRRKFA